MKEEKYPIDLPNNTNVTVKDAEIIIVSPVDNPVAYSKNSLSNLDLGQPETGNQEAVNCFGFTPYNICHAQGSTTSRCGKENLQLHGLKQFYDYQSWCPFCHSQARRSK